MGASVRQRHSLPDADAQHLGDPVLSRSVTLLCVNLGRDSMYQAADRRTGGHSSLARFGRYHALMAGCEILKHIVVRGRSSDHLPRQTGTMRRFQFAAPAAQLHHGRWADLVPLADCGQRAARLDRARYQLSQIVQSRCCHRAAYSTQKHFRTRLDYSIKGQSSLSSQQSVDLKIRHS